MNIFKKIKEQFADVIEWKNQQADVLWWKYPGLGDEIKDASKLIIAPGQGAVLVYEGAIADVISEPGNYTLETDNHPFITTLLNLRQKLESEHKLRVYFYKTAEMVNQDWGTAQPVKYFDAAYQIAVELGAYGSFSYRIADISHLFTNIIGSKDIYTAEEMRGVLTSRIGQFIAAVLAEGKYPFTEIDSRLPEIAGRVNNTIQQEYERLGMVITDFKILGTNYDADTKVRIGRVSDVAADVTAAKAAGLNYVELERLRALRDAARNEGGLAGIGAQMGAGMEVGKIFSLEKDKAATPSADAVETLQGLKLLMDENIITAEEFEAKKKDILNKM